MKDKRDGTLIKCQLAGLSPQHPHDTCSAETMCFVGSTIQGTKVGIRNNVYISATIPQRE